MSRITFTFHRLRRLHSNSFVPGESPTVALMLKGWVPSASETRPATWISPQVRCSGSSGEAPWDWGERSSGWAGDWDGVGSCSFFGETYFRFPAVSSLVQSSGRSSPFASCGAIRFLPRAWKYIGGSPFFGAICLGSQFFPAFAGESGLVWQSDFPARTSESRIGSWHCPVGFTGSSPDWSWSRDFTPSDNLFRPL